MGAAAAIVGVGVSLWSAYEQSQAQGRQADAAEKLGEYQAKIYEQNAANAEVAAKDVMRVGELNAQRLGQQTGELIGSQRTAYAGQGVETGSGSAAAVAADTLRRAGVDESTIRTNAWRDALGIRQNAQNMTEQAKFARLQASEQAKALREGSKISLLTGGLNAVNQYAGYYYNEKKI